MRRYGLLLAFMLAVLFFLQGLLGNQKKSLTWDEPSYISAGYTYLKWGDFQLNPSHPPLMQDLAALPLLFMELNVPAKDHPSWKQNVNPVVEFGRQFLFESGNDLEKITFWARLPVLILGAGLVCAIYVCGRSLFGTGPALLAAALAALSPNLLTHAKVATEDLGCTAFMFFAVCSLWRALDKKRLVDWLLCGLVTGMALIAKYTSLILGPIFIVLALLVWWPRRTTFSLADLLKGGLIIAVVSALVIGVGYNCTFDYATYLAGIKKIYTDYPTGLQYYLYGKVYDQPVWYYHVAVFLIKVPVPVLLLLLLSMLQFIRYREKREEVLFLLVPICFMIVVSFFDKHNIGFRRILPIFPFVFLLCGSFVLGRVSVAKGGVVGLLLGWMVFEAWIIYPHHLSYLNTFVGGAQRGPYLLDDSNIDWGEDLPALADWQRENGKGRPLKLFYFGMADPRAYGIENLIPMSQNEIMFPQPGLYAISAHNLVYFRIIHVTDGYDVDWLTKYQPVGYAGNSIYIYEFP